MSTISTSRARVTPWLGVLFVLVFVLNGLGGWVRLSGSGVAIPHWPLIERDGGYTLLPPFSAAGWQQMHEAWQQHQAHLRTRIAAGELAVANLGHQPADTGEFRSMFLTEWSHRALAGFVGLLALACLIAVWRDRALRALVARPVSVAVGLIVVQGIIGGVLVEEGTSTRWLFVHQANAGLIMAALLWSLLRLVDGRACVKACL
jgi:heme A synthase